MINGPIAVQIPGLRGPVGGIGGNVSAIALFAASGGIAAPQGVPALRTAGHTKPGLGIADYIYDQSVTSAYVSANPKTAFLSSTTISGNPLGFRLTVDGAVNVRKCGAVGDGVTDDTAAFQAAIALAILSNVPIYVPAGLYVISQMLQLLTGMVGEGAWCTKLMVSASSLSYWNGFVPNDTVNNLALVRIGGKVADSAAINSAPFRGFGIVGLATRTATRSSNPATCNFLGNGILFDENCGFIHLVDVTVNFFYKGIVHNNNAGHLGGTNLQVSNCWYNLYWERNTGDYRYFDCVFTGALFATYGSHGTSKIAGVSPGGIGALLLMGCHGGFSPYGFYQEDGNGTLGLLGLTLINSSFEQIGNKVARLGAQTSGQLRVSGAISIHFAGHTWTNNGLDASAYQAYTITGDSNNPIQDYAISEIQLLQGGPLQTSLQGLLAGTSGYVAKIDNALDFICDFRGQYLYQVVTQGKERNVGHGRGYEIDLLVNSPAVASDNTMLLGSFDIPQTFDGAARGKISMHHLMHNTSAAAANLQVLLFFNGVQQPGFRFVACPVGYSDIDLTASFAMPAANRAGSVFNVTVKLGGVPASGFALNDAGLPGETIFQVLCNTGSV